MSTVSVVVVQLDLEKPNEAMYVYPLLFIIKFLGLSCRQNN